VLAVMLEHNTLSLKAQTGKIQPLQLSHLLAVVLLVLGVVRLQLLEV
tara:strand:- start:386 stop:526 length:141 start_codon:yes stop_codon:yes gene_type:complete